MITTEQLKRACREFYEKKNLTAQKKDGSCVLLDEEGYRCAIGAAMTLQQIEGVKNVSLTTPYYLQMSGVVEFEDVQEASYIQKLHDKWLDDATDGEAEANFLEAIRTSSQRRQT